MEKYKYTQRWFLGSEIQNRLINLVDVSNEHHILEIGCFEGLSSVYFAGVFLNHPNSTLTCVDPFLNMDNNDHEEFIINNNAESSFDYNISVCNNAEKITVHKITSDDFFKNNLNTYDIIYIDGCHLIDFISRDMKNAFHVLKHNGIMWMDDYEGGDGIKIKDVMHSFLKEYQNQYILIHKGYQLAIKKII